MPETSVSAIPALTHDQIQARVGPQSFQRGLRYFHEGAIFDPRVQGTTLKARCLGSSGGPYRLCVTFGQDGIRAANCSCPVGDGGYCKHIVALLLTWRARPMDFHAVKELDTVLDQRSKEELIALVKQMLRQEPELESLLEMPLPTGRKGREPIDPEIWQRQAEQVFSAAQRSWQSPDDVAEKLTSISSIGDDFARQQDYINAAAVYEAVALASLKHFESYDEESGALHGVISQCLGGLGECLAYVQDRLVRQRMLHVLFEAFRHDVGLGGLGLGEDGPELILEHANAEERRIVAGWVRETLPKGGGGSATWKRGILGGFLLDLELDTLDDEAFLRVCQETGRTQDLVDRLLSLDRVEEAARATNQATDYELLQLADIFDSYEHGDVAEQLIKDRAQSSQDIRLVDWIKERSLSRGDRRVALDLAERLFLQRPDLARYRELRDLAQPADHLPTDHTRESWETIRSRVLTFLHDQRWNDLLVAVYLEEGEIDLALESLSSIQSHVMSYSYGLYGTEPLAMQVARAAAESRPHAALEIYDKQAERLIAGRNRNTYAQAAGLLVEMRDIYFVCGDGEAWSDYVSALRERYRTLRALKEELAAAGL